MDEAAARRAHLQLLETVRCLECSEVYAKPISGDTVTRNPGCPTCGYLGWLPVSVPSTPPRFGGDLQRRPHARSG